MVGGTPRKGSVRYCCPCCEAHWAAPWGTAGGNTNRGSWWPSPVWLCVIWNHNMWLFSRRWISIDDRRGYKNNNSVQTTTAVVCAKLQIDHAYNQRVRPSRAKQSNSTPKYGRPLVEIQTWLQPPALEMEPSRQKRHWDNPVVNLRHCVET